MYKEVYIAPLWEVVDVQTETVLTSGPEFDGMNPEEDW